MSEIHFERGGAQLGADLATSTSLAWPSASLTVAHDYLELAGGSETYRIDKSAISAIRKYRSIFYTGILIEHTNPDFPPFVLFYPLSYAALEQTLARFGHTVES